MFAVYVFCETPSTYRFPYPKFTLVAAAAKQKRYREKRGGGDLKKCRNLRSVFRLTDILA